MLNQITKLEKLINSELSSKVLKSFIKNNELMIEIDDNDLVEVIQFLKANEQCKFKQLIDITAVDYIGNENRFNMIYLFLSHEYNLRVNVTFNINENEIVNSLTKIFPSANWMEREVFDMYGIKSVSYTHLTLPTKRIV